MKIAVTSQNFSTITGHAGRARRFLMYDINAQKRISHSAWFVTAYA
jgi:hypothetical protein